MWPKIAFVRNRNTHPWGALYVHAGPSCSQSHRAWLQDKVTELTAWFTRFINCLTAASKINRRISLVAYVYSFCSRAQNLRGLVKSEPNQRLQDTVPNLQLNAPAWTLFASCPNTPRKCSRSPKLQKQLEVQSVFETKFCTSWKASEGPVSSPDPSLLPLYT